MQRMMGIVRRVTFPSFSAVHRQVDRLRRGFLQSIKYLFMLLFPASLGIAILGPSLIHALYGDRWMPSAIALQILAITGLSYGIDIAESLYFAVGRPSWRIAIFIVRFGLFVVFVISFGLRWGIEGVALSLALSAIVSLVLGLVLASRIVHVSPFDVLRQISPPAYASILAAVPTVVLTFVVLQNKGALFRILIAGSLMFTIYVTLIFRFMPKALGRLWLDAKRAVGGEVREDS
jgi:O-antigen/teichoic acid export membrane protein